MAVKLADTLAPMGNFEVAKADNISVKIGANTKMLQTAIDNGEIGGGGGSLVEDITQDEYDALTEEEKLNGTTYYITDSKCIYRNGNQYAEVELEFTGTIDEWNDLSEEEKTKYDGKKVNITDDVNNDGTIDKYSTNEVKTNKVWIDGKPVYRKVFNNISFGNGKNSWVSINASLPNVNTFISCIALRTSDKTVVNHFNFKLSGNIVYLFALEDFQGSNIIITEYTKTTD